MAEEPLIPRLRPIEAFPIRVDGQDLICLRDPSGSSESVLTVSRNRVLYSQGSAAIDALRHYPQSCKAHVDAAIHHRKAGKTALARRELEEALWIKPRYRLARIWMGILLIDEVRLEEAEAYFLRLRDDYPGSGEVIHHLATTIHAEAG